MKVRNVFPILSFILLSLSVIITGCKQKDLDIFHEALTKASMIEQGNIVMEIDANIQFDHTLLTEKEVIEIAQYEHIQTKINVQIKDKRQTAIEMILFFGATSLQTEIFLLEKDVYIKLPIVNLYIVLEQADYLQDIISGINLQEELLYLMGTSKDDLVKYWFSLMEGDIDESGKKNILTPIGTREVLYINQTVQQEKLMVAMEFLRNRSPVLDEFLSAHHAEFSFYTKAKVETYITKDHQVYKQVLNISGLHADENVSDYIFYPIKEYSITITLDYSQLGDSQTMELPNITQENTVTREEFYRILNQLLP